jgi:hypothetical protein
MKRTLARLLKTSFYRCGKSLIPFTATANASNHERKAERNRIDSPLTVQPARVQPWQSPNVQLLKRLSQSGQKIPISIGAYTSGSMPCSNPCGTVQSSSRRRKPSTPQTFKNLPQTGSWTGPISVFWNYQEPTRLIVLVKRA